MAVVDASVYVALLNSHEERHQDAWAWFKAASSAGDGITAPTILVTEVAGAIRRGSGQPTMAQRAVQQLLGANIVELVPITIALAARSAAIAIDCRLRGADALYVALAERNQDELITFDRQQRERGAKVVSTRCPEARPQA